MTTGQIASFSIRGESKARPHRVMFASRDDRTTEKQGHDYLPHSEYTSHPHPTESTPALECLPESPTRSRPHEYRHSQGSSRSNRSSLSVITDDFSTCDKFGDHGLTLDDHFISLNSPDPLHTIETPFPRYGVCRYITEADKNYRFLSCRGIMNLGAVFIILGGLIILFVGWPLWLHLAAKPRFNLQSAPLARRSTAFLLARDH